MEERLEVLECSNKELKERLASAGSSEPAVKVSDPSFDSPPTLPSPRLTLRPWCPKRWFLRQSPKLRLKPMPPLPPLSSKGAGVDKWFSIVFKGTPLSAQEYAQKRFISLRSEGDGGSVTWERVMVKERTGALVQIFLGPDKSQKQVRTEILLKNLGSIIRGERIGQVDLERYSGQVLASWQPLAVVVVKSKDEVELLWDTEKLYC